MYARKYPPGLNEQEAENPLEAYRSFNAVFTRGVKPEYRPDPCRHAGNPQPLRRHGPGCRPRGTGPTLDRERD